MKKQYIALSFIMFITFNSCSKSDSPDPGNPSQPINPAQKQPLISTIKSYKNTGAIDTLLTLLRYDDKPRIIGRDEIKNGVSQAPLISEETKYDGSKVIKTYTANQYPHVITYDTIEYKLDGMASKKSRQIIMNEVSVDLEWKTEYREVTIYNYLPTGEYKSEIKYAFDTVFWKTAISQYSTSRKDTINNSAEIENNNIKYLIKTTRSYDNKWSKGTVTVLNTITTEKSDYFYTKNYPSPPLHPNNFEYRGDFYPFIYLSSIKNFKNIPDRIAINKTVKNIDGTLISSSDRNWIWNVTFNDKGFIKKIESTEVGYPSYEFSYDK